MSYDVQMFVQCDHIVTAKGFPNPTVAPTLTSNSNNESQLSSGTYYVSYTWANDNGETMTSQYSKIYLDGTQELKIKCDMFAYEDVEININAAIYVSYVDSDLSGELSQGQLALEEEAIKIMKKQGVTNDGNFTLTNLIYSDNLKPGGNSTTIKSFVDSVSNCTKCYGKEFYFDIFFDVTGQAVTADSSVKLLQELLKVVIEDKTSNLFHPEWGSDITRRIGTKKRGVADKFKVELAVRNAIEYLKGIQESNQQVKKNMRPQEMIQAIQSIVIEEEGVTGYNVSVEVLSKAGELISYSVNL